MTMCFHLQTHSLPFSTQHNNMHIYIENMPCHAGMICEWSIHTTHKCMYAAGAYLHFPNPHTCFNRFYALPPTFLHHRRRLYPHST